MELEMLLFVVNNYKWFIIHIYMIFRAIEKRRPKDTKAWKDPLNESNQFYSTKNDPFLRRKKNTVPRP